MFSRAGTFFPQLGRKTSISEAAGPTRVGGVVGVRGFARGDTDFTEPRTGAGLRASSLGPIKLALFPERFMHDTIFQKGGYRNTTGLLQRRQRPSGRRDTVTGHKREAQRVWSP
jgi:hypothetical protein